MARFKSKTQIVFESKINELKHLGIKITPEFKFCEYRKFKADFMLEYNGTRILVEYEGIFATKSRHTSFKGYSTDAEKYNLACKLGFQLLRYTAINYKNITKDVTDIFGI